MKIIGLIGCGNWGSNILRDLIQLSCEVYVVDIDFQARSRAKANGAQQVLSKTDDLPVCDGYVVAVPIPDLTKETAGLLRFKKPIFSEKTLCLSILSSPSIRQRRDGNEANIIVFPSQSKVPIAHR